MADEKKLRARSKIERALGLIEGLSHGVDEQIADALTEAVEEIDCALKVVFDDA